MEQKISGLVVLTFTIDGRGAPRDIEASGNDFLTAEVKSAFRDIRLPRACSGNHVSISVRFRIDPDLDLQMPVVSRQVSETEYEVTSPAKNIVVIVDPPVMVFRPGDIPVEVWPLGDDGLTVNLGVAVASAFGGSRGFFPSSGRQPGTLIVNIPKHVGWKEFGERTQVQYAVDFTTVDGVTVGRTEGKCWEDALDKCAKRIRAAARGAVRKMPRNPVLPGLGR